MIIRKITGFVLLLIGLVGVVLAIGAYIVSPNVVDAVVDGLDSTLALTSESLSTVDETLALAQTTITDVNTGLDTVGETAVSLSQTIKDTQPMLDQVTQITSQDAPNSIESVQAAIPNVAEVAGVIDDTLITLNAFKIDESFLGIDLNYDLGINYEPTVSFDETVTELGSSLDGLPEQLRDLEPSLVSASENMDTISDSIVTISGDLDNINGRIAEVNPLLDDYKSIIGEINDTVQQIQTSVSGQVGTAKLVLRVVAAWMGFMQFSLLYLGWDLMTREDDDDDEEEN